MSCSKIARKKRNMRDNANESDSDSDMRDCANESDSDSDIERLVLSESENNSDHDSDLGSPIIVDK